MRGHQSNTQSFPEDSAVCRKLKMKPAGEEQGKQVPRAMGTDMASKVSEKILQAPE